MVKVAYIVSHPIQYQAPLLRLIAQDPSIDLTVFFLSDLSLKPYQDKGFGAAISWDVPLVEGYKYEFLPAIGSISEFSALKPLSYGIAERLKQGQFDVLWTHGYSHYANVLAVAAARRLGMKVLMRGESNLISAPRSAAKQAIKDRFLRWLFGRCDGYLCIGSLNREYYRHYGVSEAQLFSMPYSVDNAFFQERATEAKAVREDFRASLNLEAGRPVILYASKLMERKHPMDLLEAYAKLSTDGNEPRPYLLYVGGGEEESKLKARAQELGWDSVRFLGFRNQTELPAFFDLCDVFVLASTYEPWGLIVNEVMNAAKPVIVSDQVGCALDLVKNGENGFIVPPRDVEALATALDAVLSDSERAMAMGRRSLEIINHWGFREDLDGLKEAVSQVMAGVAAPNGMN